MGLTISVLYSSSALILCPPIFRSGVMLESRMNFHCRPCPSSAAYALYPIPTYLLSVPKYAAATSAASCRVIPVISISMPNRCSLSSNPVPSFRA